MKKVLSIILVLILSLALVACGSKENEPSGSSGNNGSSNTGNNNSSSSSSEKKDDSSSNSSSSNSSSSSSSDSNTSSQSDSKDDSQSGGSDRSSMEKKIASYLSAIGGPNSISICDGNISYEPWSEWSIYGDQWTISQAKTTSEELKASLDKQLIDDCDFQSDVSLFGRTYFKRAGSKQLGLMVNVDSEDNGTTVTIWMTHSPDSYSQDFIKAQEASMPKIIPAANALEILPDNYDIEVDYGFMKARYARKDGNYFYAYSYPEEDGEAGYSRADAYIKNDAGGYDQYSSTTNYGGGYAEDAKFNKEGTVTEEKLQELLADWYDFEGYDDNGNLSTWGQMSKDFRDGVSFLGANSRFSISQSLEKTGTENIAGVDCDVCQDSGWFSQNSFAYDPNTGIMFRIVKTESESDEVVMVITKYDTNPSSLGNYKS